MHRIHTPKRDYPGYVEIDCARRVKIEDSRPPERICGSAISGTKHIDTGEISSQLLHERKTKNATFGSSG